MYDIITMGSSTVDVFANTQSQLVKFVTNDGEDDYIAYPSGSKILIKNLSFLVGGGGTNTAVSFSRLGFRTAYLGKVGVDSNSKRVMEFLEQENISFIGQRDGQTGYSIILDSIENDRTILTFKGANDELDMSHLNEDQIDGKWLYSSSLTGHSFETLKEVAKIAHAKHMKIAFNPSNYQAAQGYEALIDFIEICDVLVMNKEEMELLFDHKKRPELFSQFLEDHPHCYFVVTDGSRGAVCYHHHELCLITPSPGLNVIETTGAGDAFASGFVSGLARSWSLADSLKLGMVQAESVIQSVGAKEKLLTMDEAQQRVNHFQGTINFKEEMPHFTPKKNAEKTLPQFYSAPNDQAFHFENGQIIHDLEELGYYVRFMPEHEFLKHVGVEFNHFADWIDNVFHLKNLSSSVRQHTEREHISKLIIDFVHTGEHHER